MLLNLALLSMTFMGASAGDTCQNIAGNYYCDETKLVQFYNVGLNGHYDRVTSFNSDGTCSSTPQSFSGSLSPFNEELSVHFRGPIQLEHFKVFNKGSNSGAYNQKRDVQQHLERLHHRHAEPEPEPVYVTATDYYTAYVTAGADGAPVTPQTTSSESPAAPPAPQTTSSSSEQSVPVYNYNYNHLDQTSQTGPSVITRTTSPTEPAVSKTTSPTSSQNASPTTSSSSSSSAAPAPTSGGDGWSLSASYDAGAQNANGLVFLNNFGGSGSGTFDFQFGNSLSYASANGQSGASSPQVLQQTTVGSNKEFVIFSDSKCEGDSCGYYRPGTVAYHGFGGANKVFVFEFGMPSDGSSGFNADMPAVWLLNAQIPRTLQYGAKSCSCWSTGCGELDLWEVLNSGNNRLTTTLHAKQNGGGGTADYFARPTQGTLKGAVILSDTTITVVEIPEIPDSIDDNLIQSWISQGGRVSKVNM